MQQRLSRNGLLLRYERGQDGIAVTEGAFGICSFWAIDNLAKRGDTHEAQRASSTCSASPTMSGFSPRKSIPSLGALLGNFPQAYTHVGLINAALALREAS